MGGTARASIRYGPFPLRIGRILGALAALFVAVLSTAAGLETQYLRCEFEPNGTCVIESVVSFKGDARFASADLRTVRVETVWRGKGRGVEYGVVILSVGNRAHRLIEIDPGEADEIARQVAEAMLRRSSVQATLSVSRWPLLFGAVCALVMVSMAWTGMRRMGALSLALGYGGELLVERRVFGVPLSARTLMLGGVTNVDIEWSDEADFWRTRGEAPRRVGRIVFVTENGVLPVTPEFWPGETLHYRAAAELRQAFGFSPGRLETELHTLETSRVRPPFARSSWGLFGLCWAGLCTGTLVGIAIFGTVGLAIGGLRLTDGIEPWMLLVGGGGGAVAGVLFVLYLARPRAPR